MKSFYGYPFNRDILPHQDANIDTDKKSSLDKIRDENLCEEEKKFLTTISSNQNDEE